MSSSSQYHLVLCLFLLSFSSLINSQKYFVVKIKNDTPNTVNASCSLDGSEPPTDIPIESKKGYYEIDARFDPEGNNTFSCEMKSGEKHGVFMLFDSNDKKICHTVDGACEWSIGEDGLCMLVVTGCVMFNWDTNTTTHYSFRNIASEPIKYVARNTMRYMSNNP
uniref:S-protein homolog n=1 Tax=Solanum tuberosum TaxID=4113 RepID=M1CI87_SOLTU